MKAILSILFVLSIMSGDHGGMDRITQVNKHKNAGAEAFKAQDYKTAINEFTFLLDSLKEKDDTAMLDLAHAYFKSNDFDKAKERYANIQNAADKKISSIANQQLGVILSQDPKELEKAISFTKTAIKHDPNNLQARYNYELLLKKKQQQDQENQDNKDDQNKDQQDQDKQDQDQQDQNKDENKDENKENEENKDNEKENENKEQEGDDQEKEEEESQPQESQEEKEQKEKEKELQEFQERMQEIKMPKEQAQMILDALKNNEVQFFQQQKKQSNKKTDSDMKDW
ncbi:tetratricopeptide repeat protein [Flammeovirga pacifica]|uniref:Uncharacterized protein n=1 Tax=Flammeovirga pacifica TaxID=915059 RepID=A0A1S1Z4I5_FLAPC|nr:tetratricopeptide repeat protein [Flammeovirga pacifica]OHX68190.1 hypothetical protein NH26_18475 [Flammeovirga pacifica]